MENGKYNISALSLSRPSEVLEKLTLTGSSLLLIVATIVNILAHFVIALIFLKSRPFRQSRHYYILSVAFSDFFTGMTTPFLIVESMNSRWTLDPYLCPMFLVVRHSMMFISLLSVLLFTLDRWWSITYPLSYRARQSQQKSVLVLIIVWIFAAIVHIPAIFVWNSQYMNNGFKLTFCLYPYNFDRIYTISSTLLEFFLPIASLLTLNVSIYVVLVRRRNATEIRRSLSTSERAVRSRKDNLYPCCIPNCHCKSTKANRLQPRSTQMVKNHSASELPTPANNISIDSRSRSLEAVSAVSCQYNFLRKESDNLVRDFLLRQSMRALCSVGILTICAILFRSPYVIAILVNVFSCPVPSGILIFLQNLTVINASINPFLYNLGNKTIKKTIRSCIKSKLKKTDKFGENLASMYCILERNGKVSTILNQRT
ncbi:histamine H3 receptor-like [Saccostrea cucullata]|uniref:histamine H3 receptor-like n=1 Tax=Saccostrea cuccullata TaxID=36930 RepID=UPI002ED04074